jgi:mono/diheme cytochrome c family protein
MLRWTLPLALFTLAAVFAGLKFMIAPPIPASVLTIYMALAALGVAVFIGASEARWRTFLAPLVAVFSGRAPRSVQALTLAGLPLVAAYGAWLLSSPSQDAPFEPRVIHPEPPSTIVSHGRRIAIAGLLNPLRASGQDVVKHTAEGKAIYYRNCFFCHGDTLAGDGHFANAFWPIPANFRDVGTISMLQESFVYWRVATGGPGLPKSATPWHSAMPAWQNMLSEEDIWKAILFIYAGSGSTPRTWDEEVKHDHKP